MAYNEIATLVYAITLLVFLLGACIVCSLYGHKVDKLRESFLKELDEHDKAVVASYKSLRPRLQDIFKKD